MSQICRSLRALRSESGQGMTEYIIIVGLVAIAAIGVVTVFGDNVRGLFGMAAGALNGDKVEKTVRDVGGTSRNVTITDFNSHIDGK